MAEKLFNRTSSTQSSEQPCRSCVDFKTWSKQQRENLSSKSINKNNNKPVANNKADDEPRRLDCPLDKDELGRSTWGLLHTIGATYPENPTDNQKKDIKDYFNILSRIYPCKYCADDLRVEIKKDPIDTTSQTSVSQWLCRLHNTVNEKLGKPLFDCSKVNERWRDGWLDGSCD